MEKISQTLSEAGEALLAWLPGAAWKLVEILLALIVSWVLYRLLKRSITGIIRRLNANRAIPTSERKLNTTEASRCCSSGSLSFFLQLSQSLICWGSPAC